MVPTPFQYPYAWVSETVPMHTGAYGWRCVEMTAATTVEFLIQPAATAMAEIGAADMAMIREAVSEKHPSFPRPPVLAAAVAVVAAE